MTRAGRQVHLHARLPPPLLVHTHAPSTAVRQILQERLRDSLLLEGVEHQGASEQLLKELHHCAHKAVLKHELAGVGDEGQGAQLQHLQGG